MKLSSSDQATVTPLQKITLEHWQDICIVLLMGILLYVGCSWQIFRTNTDVAKYECYAVAFWQGTEAFKSLPAGQCDFALGKNPSFVSSAPSTKEIVRFLSQAGMPSWLTDQIAAQFPTQSFHALPHEYPLLNIFIFSLTLTAPVFFSQIAYAVWMILLATAIYLVLLRYRSRGAAVACALYFVAGGWGTLAGRYDIVPAAFTLFALLCAVKNRWNWAFALLAVATLLKFYPVLLLPFFLLAQQKATQGSWYSLRRWVPLAIFVALCCIVMGVSLFLSVEGTLAPFFYFVGRPIQVESFASSLLWLLDLLTGQAQSYAYTFGSLNVVSPFAGHVGSVISLMEVAGLLYLL
ncbi:MAG: DUF2029 domain-containing protein, partial [Ktedonobacteraceae bacterium]|nr:DUF2029 domain-containing protein [Ktedonobacteraceae bacterium]